MSTAFQLGDIPVSWIIMIHGLTHKDGLLFPKNLLDYGWDKWTRSRWMDRRNERGNTWDQAARSVGISHKLLTDLGKEEFTPSSPTLLLASPTLSQQLCRGHATRTINWINKDVRHGGN